jgi:hypothetical protein
MRLSKLKPMAIVLLVELCRKGETLVGPAIVQPAGLLASLSESILLKFPKFVRPVSIPSPFHPLARKEISGTKRINRF